MRVAVLDMHDRVLQHLMQGRDLLYGERENGVMWDIWIDFVAYFSLNQSLFMARFRFLLLIARE